MKRWKWPLVWLAQWASMFAAGLLIAASDLLGAAVYAAASWIGMPLLGAVSADAPGPAELRRVDCAPGLHGRVALAAVRISARDGAGAPERADLAGRRGGGRGDEPAPAAELTDCPPGAREK